MKCVFNISDIYIDKYILQSILYCNPFADFNNCFVNQINILITENKIELNIVKDSETIKTITLNISFIINKFNNIKKFKKLCQENINCQFDSNFTLEIIQKFLNTIDIIIFELLKYYQFVRKRLKLQDNMFILLNIDNVDYIIGFPINCEINRVHYNYCLCNFYLWLDNLFICQFRLQNTNSTNIMNINEIVLDDLQTIIAIEPDDSELIDDAHFIILLPFYYAQDVIYHKNHFKNLLMQTFNESIYNEELMSDFSLIDNYIYNITSVHKFIKRHINILFKNANLFFAIFVFDDTYLVNRHFLVEDEFNEED